MGNATNWLSGGRKRNWYLAVSMAITFTLVIGALAASISDVLAQDSTKQISVNSSHEGTTLDCAPGQQILWHFVINQLRDGDAPASITVTFANAGTVNVPLRDHPSATAHYDVYTGPNDTMVTATATIYSSWNGNFNLSSYECSGTPDPDPVPATAQVQKVTVPAGDEAGWEFTLLENNFEVASLTTTGSGPHSFNYDLVGGASYEIVETGQGGFTQTGASGCTFQVSYPGDNGEKFQCTITNTADSDPDPDPGTIVIQKVTDPAGSDESFNFTADGYADFSLKDGESNNSGNLSPGSYTVTEAEVAGWELDGIQCDAGAATSVLGNSVTIELGENETVTCTFTNSETPPPPPEQSQIIIQKVTDPEGSADSFDFVVDGYADFSLTHGQSDNSGDLDPGTYVITETVSGDWELTNIVCNAEADATVAGNGVTIELGEEETVTCTFTNVERGEGTGIIVEKVVDGDSDGEEFSFTISGPDLSDSFGLEDGDSTHYEPLDPGTYTITELVNQLPDGWSLIDIEVSPSSAETSSNTANGEAVVELESGQTIRITYTNQPPEDTEPDPGQINITKMTDNAASGESFSFNASYYGSSFDLEHGETDNSGDLEPDVYTVTEQVPEGWNLSNVSCDADVTPVSDGVQIDLEAGQEVNCTFTNTEVPPPPPAQGQIIVNKVTNPAGHAETFEFEADGYADFSLQHGQSNNSGALDPGSYIVTETVPGNWNLEEISCNADVERVGDSIEIDLAADQTVICTFLNVLETIPIEEAPGEITIVKETAEPSDMLFSFDGDFGEFELGDGDSRTFSDLDLGDYSVSEMVPDDWTLTSITCDSTSVSITDNAVTIALADEGQSVTCTFLNTEDEDETIPIEDDDETRTDDDDDEELRPDDDDEDETLPIEDKPKRSDDKKKPGAKHSKSDDDALPLMPNTGSGPGTAGASLMSISVLMLLGSAALVAGLGIEVRRKLRKSGF